MDILTEAFTALRRAELVGSQTDFSVDWLNKSPRYYSMIKASGREPSLDAVTRLAANLRQVHDACKESHFGELRAKAEAVAPILRATWMTVYRSGLSRQPDARN